ncbi:MAG TPA: ABC transporter substrate-binding protein [Chloroflexota bacterium]|nr:ABC transporter substrate-binding protein [Chloroflexota bacterium]
MLLVACGGGASAPASSAAPASSPATSASAKPAASASVAAKPAASANASAKPAGSAAASPAAKGKMVAGYAVLSASQSPLWGAADGGYFAQHGLDVEVIKAGAGSVGISALLSGQIQGLMTSAGSVMNASLEGADLVYVGSIFDKIQQFMIAKADRSDLNSPKDMKGKKVAMTTPGALSDLSAHLLAHDAGLTDKDFTILRMNDLPTIRSAVLNGAVDLGMVDSVAGGMDGLKVVADVSKLDVPVSNVGIAASRSYYQQHGAEYDAFKLAIDDSIKRIKTDAAFRNALLKKYLSIDDPKQQEAFSQELLPTMKDEISINKQGIENARMYAAYSIPKLDQFDINKIIP